MPGSPERVDFSVAEQDRLTRGLRAMTIAEFVRHLRSLGVELRAKDDKLLVSAPAGAMTAALQEEVRGRKAGLLELLLADVNTEEERCAPLTFAQQRLWLIDRFAPETAVYNIPQSWRIDSPIDIAVFGRALDRLAERHQTLRTRIELRNGEPVQIVLKQERIPLRFTNLTSCAESEREDRIKAETQREGREPFALDQAPLIRFHIFRLTESSSLVAYGVHHIIADQWSLDVLKRDLAALYQEIATGVPAELRPLALQYVDVAEEERGSAAARLHDDQLAYWRERLKEMPTLLELPFSKTRGGNQSYAGATLAVGLDARLTGKLRQLAARSHTTLYMLMLTAFVALLYRYTGQSDVCVGTPVSGRNKREEEELIGLFVNMLPLRCEVKPAESFTELLKRTSRSVLADFEHGDIPFQKLVMEVHPQRSQAYSPLFQVMFALNPKATSETQGQEETFIGVSKFDMTLQISERAQTLDAYLEYRTDLFDEADMERFGRHLVCLVESIVERPEDAVGSLSLLTADEAKNLRRWSATELAFDRSATLIDLFIKQAALSPDAIALSCGASGYTYRELQERVDSFAAVLCAYGAGPGGFVALCLDRSPELIIAMLAILKAGAAYLPLDPKYPEERLAYMLDDSGARILITQRDDSGAEPIASGPEVRVIEAHAVLSAFGTEARAGGVTRAAKAEDAAYLIYTSGSTGKPKGVVVENRNATALIAWAASYFDADALRGVLASTSVCFDLSVFEIFLPLSTGNMIVLVDDVLELARTPLAEKVTLVNTVPSAMQALLRAGLPPSVSTVCMAGEFLPTELVDRVYAAGVKCVFDLYGPTETTTYSTCGLRKPGVQATIGKPIANTRVYVLDENLCQAPPGAVGEIYIGGEGVTRGYLHRPELTAERYVKIADVEPEGRLYRTGDLARQLEDGALVFLGRRDQQIKLRGHRIELGEIEAVLREVTGRSQVAVVVQQLDAGDGLVAFVEEDAERPVDANACAEALRRRLPGYMVPALILPVRTMPHTPNGKIDRKALALMREQLAGRRAKLDDAAQMPRDILEQWLVNIWAHRLGAARVGRDAHFFEELGGHSLAAFEIFAEIETRLGVAMMLATLFQAPTVALLAAAIRRLGWNEPRYIRLLAPAGTSGAADRAIYVVGRAANESIDDVRTMGERVMAIGSGETFSLAEEIGLCAAEIVRFEATNPALVFDVRHVDADAAEKLRSNLIKAGLVTVSLRYR